MQQEYSSICSAPTPPEQTSDSFNLEMNEIGLSFHEKLFELIDTAGIDNKDVWKKANIDKQYDIYQLNMPKLSKYKLKQIKNHILEET